MLRNEQGKHTSVRCTSILLRSIILTFENADIQITGIDIKDILPNIFVEEVGNNRFQHYGIMLVWKTLTWSEEAWRKTKY